MESLIPKAWIYQRMCDLLIQHGYPHMDVAKVYELAPELYEIAKKEVDLKLTYQEFVEAMKLGEQKARMEWGFYF